MNSSPVSAAEAKSFFSDLEHLPVVVLAVSGGPDSTALMVLAARWRKTLKAKAGAARRYRRSWPAQGGQTRSGGGRASRTQARHRAPHVALERRKPRTGLQEAARTCSLSPARGAARKAGASHILTAHTRDDQAETVLIRLTRGSGVSGLARHGANFRRCRRRRWTITLVRPLLDIAKARLVATLHAAKIPFADDPSNRDPRFTRARLRGLMPSSRARASTPIGWRYWRAAQAGGPGDRSRGRRGRDRAGAAAVRPGAVVFLPPLCPLAGRDRAAPARPRAHARRRRRPGRIGQAGSAESRARCCPKFQPTRGFGAVWRAPL